MLAVPRGGLHVEVAPASEFGSDIDFFVLPPIDPSSRPRDRYCGVRVALVDTPEVREFMEFLASPEFGEHWAAEPGDGFIPPTAGSIPRPTAT